MQGSGWYLYHRARSLDEIQRADPTELGWLVSQQRVLRGWGFPVTEVDAADQSRIEDWDEAARERQSHHYHRIRSAEQAKIALAAGVPIDVCIEINEQWQNAQDGVISPLDLPAVGTHIVHLVKHKPKYSRFVFLNTWGESWGHKGYGSFTENYFDRHVVEAWAKFGGEVSMPETKTLGACFYAWVSSDAFGLPLFGAEVIDTMGRNRVAWGFAVLRDKFLDVEECFVKPAHRNQGWGTQLVEAFRSLANRLGINIRLWIPFADCSERNLSALSKLVGKVGLELVPSETRWAAYRAVQHSRLQNIYLPPGTVGEGSSAPPAATKLPPRPRFYAGAVPDQSILELAGKRPVDAVLEGDWDDDMLPS